MKPLTAEAALHRRCRIILDGMRRRARAEGKTLAYGLRDLLQLAGPRVCTYCRMPLALDFQVDHRTPLARGGNHELYNLDVVCKRCNALKGNLTWEEFLLLRTFLGSLPLAASDGLMRRLLRGATVYAGSRRKKG